MAGAKGKKKDQPQPVVIEDSSEDELVGLPRLRKSLNEIHWHSGRIRFFQTELESHLQAVERAAYEAEDALEEILHRKRNPSPSPTGTNYSTALSRRLSDDSLYDDSETEELIRRVQLDADGTPISARDRSPICVPSTPGSRHPESSGRPSSGPPSPSLKRAIPPRSPIEVLSPSIKRRARKGPKGGFLVLNGKDGVSAVFESWASAASVGQNVSGAIIQGFNSFEEAQTAYDACSSSGLLAYLTMPSHEKKWFVVLRGHKRGVCQKATLLDMVGAENLENIQVTDILVAETEAEAWKLFKRGRH
ncbi:hypothetical protein VNI00_018039 [Paramarasmius palmivorus]|uniref:Uncharacterized protein n=1 Tax=Paramarasmius palmivorus TaxID=297713 RepID=A0AAW0B129_9AGAR